MTKTEGTDFQELFGASTVRESLDATVPVIHRRQEPTLPTDSPMWPFTPASPTGTANTVQDLDFIKTVSGWDAPIAQPTPAPDLGKKFLADAMYFTKRAMRLDKSEPRRRRELGAIIDRWARDYGFPESVRPELERVKESASTCLRQILMEVS